MLTGAEIKRLYEKSELTIRPFDIKKLNPNSYNLTLSNVLKVYDLDKCPKDGKSFADAEPYLDPKQELPTKEIIIPEEGYILKPGILYLGSTVEYTDCGEYIGCIDGRSSIGRLGIMVHLTAGFGDVGFHGTWTLEITVTHSVKIYPGMEICQIYFERPDGSTSIRYHGKYLDQSGPTESKMSTEYNKR